MAPAFVGQVARDQFASDLRSARIALIRELLEYFNVDVVRNWKVST